MDSGEKSIPHNGLPGDPSVTGRSCDDYFSVNVEVRQNHLDVLLHRFLPRSSASGGLCGLTTKSLPEYLEDELDTLEDCGECARFPEDVCWTHAAVVPDKPVVPLAIASLPDCLYHLHSGESNEHTILASAALNKQTVFGPLVAPLIAVSNEDCHYATPGKGASRKYFCLDSNDRCNWMKYVQLAKSADAQNLIAYLEGQNVVFVAKRDIAYGEELKVWYSAQYAAAIGKPLLPESCRTAAIKPSEMVGQVPDHGFHLPRLLPDSSSAAAANVSGLREDIPQLKNSLPNAKSQTRKPRRASTVNSNEVDVDVRHLDNLTTEAENQNRKLPAGYTESLFMSAREFFTKKSRRAACVQAKTPFFSGRVSAILAADRRQLHHPLPNFGQLNSSAGSGKELQEICRAFRVTWKKRLETGSAPTGHKLAPTTEDGAHEEIEREAATDSLATPLGEDLESAAPTAGSGHVEKTVINMAKRIVSLVTDADRGPGSKKVTPIKVSKPTTRPSFVPKSTRNLRPRDRSISYKAPPVPSEYSLDESDPEVNLAADIISKRRAFDFPKQQLIDIDVSNDEDEYKPSSDSDGTLEGDDSDDDGDGDDDDDDSDPESVTERNEIITRFKRTGAMDRAFTSKRTKMATVLPPKGVSGPSVIESDEDLLVPWNEERPILQIIREGDNDAINEAAMQSLSGQGTRRAKVSSSVILKKMVSQGVKYHWN